MSGAKTLPPNPFDRGYMESEELRALGFAAVGEDVRVARTCTIIGLPNIRFGNHVRIDDHVIIAARSGSVSFGDRIHVGAGSYFGGGGGIALADFANLGQGVRVYSQADDFSGEHLTSPMVPAEYLGLEVAAVSIGRHVIIGTGSTVLPGCTLGEGAAVGAMSLVDRDLDAWTLYVGCPTRRIRARSRKLLELEARLKAGEG